jgi:hypothetical protein
MFEPSKETRVLLATFMAVSAGVVAGCSEESDSLVSDDTSYDRLKDDNGKEYTLIKNGDGTETAKYDDGESVTFKRDDDGNLNFVAGSAGLLAGLAAGYFLWHGLSPSGGHYDSSSRSYRPSSSVSQDIKKNGWKKYDQEKDKNKGRSGGSTYVPSSSKSSSSSSSSSSSTKSSSSSSTSKPSTSAQSKSSTPSTKSSVSAGTTKSGFGGSGARSSAAS